MGALVAADITYTVTKTKKLEDGRRMNDVTLAFGDGVKTYPTGGVPLTLGKMGVPYDLNSMILVDDGKSIYGWSIDRTNKKLVMKQLAAHAHDILLKDASTADGATTRVNAAANKLGANTGSDLTVAGAGANGGVRNSAIALPISAEADSTTAPAAQTLKFQVIGF